MEFVTQILGVAALALGTWLARRLTQPTDLQRAELLAQIAASAAALAVSMFPNAKWAELLKFVVQQIAGAAGLPTKNADAIQRAAAKALMDLGKAPDAPSVR